VSLFDPYVAQNPTHATSSSHEYIGDINTDAELVFDLGSVYQVDSMALWHVNCLLTANYSISASVDNENFQQVSQFQISIAFATGPYAVRDQALTPTPARYIKMQLTGCSSAVNGQCKEGNHCALGEVAFRTCS
jgi:F5/8 type C domain